MNKTIFITGAAKRIGKEIALTFKELGWNIIIHYNSSKEAADDLAAEINNSNVDSAVTVQGNLDVKEDVEKIIKSIGFYHVKAERIIEVAKIIDSKYKGKVPDDLEKLVALPGVGRKTANCVLVYAYEIPAIPVDIHVHRISNRLGLVKTKTPEETEFALMKKVPKKYWLDVNDTFVMYGQNICKPISPMCGVCKIRNGCNYYKINSAS